MIVHVQLSNLSKQFGTLKAVDNINLEVNPGEILGFLGPNGAGKTTVIRMVCGLLKPDDGSILFNNKTIRELPGGKNTLGVCPQENAHWERLTCREQLVFTGEMYGLSRKEAGKRCETLTNQLGISGQDRLQARHLSGGMKRRLNIALALVHDPPVLILDEPEAGLDPQGRVLMREFILNLAENRTIILTTHNMDEADRMASRVAIIDQGRIITTDTPRNLKSSITSANLPNPTLEDVFIQLTGKQLRS
jgi:ABC-2 type transport system ATP-binding protein